jgi:hypothetical protein
MGDPCCLKIRDAIAEMPSLKFNLFNLLDMSHDIPISFEQLPEVDAMQPSRRQPERFPNSYAACHNAA